MRGGEAVCDCPGERRGEVPVSAQEFSEGARAVADIGLASDG